jgi:hypothetical protein
LSLNVFDQKLIRMNCDENLPRCRKIKLSSVFSPINPDAKPDFEPSRRHCGQIAASRFTRAAQLHEQRRRQKGTLGAAGANTEPAGDVAGSDRTGNDCPLSEA